MVLPFLTLVRSLAPSLARSFIYSICIQSTRSFIQECIYLIHPSFVHLSIRPLLLHTIFFISFHFSLSFFHASKGKGNGSNTVNLTGVTSLKNTISKDPTQILSFDSASTNDKQKRTTSVQAEDPEQITSLKNQKDSDVPRRSNRNEMMVTTLV